MHKIRSTTWITILLLTVCDSGICENGYEEAVVFSIPAQRLASALDKFAATSGAEVFFSSRVTAGKENHALSGRHPTPQALQILLKGTGLEYIRGPKGAFVIRPAVAVPAAETATSTAQALTIEEVIVTSQHRSESLHKVPISITSLTRETLQEINAADISTISTHIPGLFVTNFSIGQPLIRMRGIGSGDDGAGSDIPVALYIDDVYVGRMTSINVALFDVERIEVLRGPQGTLFGRNASAGAINIISPLPSSSLEMNLTAELGNFDHRLFRGDMSGPLGVGDISGRIAFIHDYTDGYQHNLFTGDKQQGGETTAVRGRLQFGDFTGTTLSLIGDYSVDNLLGTGRIPTDPNHPSRQIFEAHGGDPRHALNDEPGFSDRRNYGITLRLETELDDIQLTAISAWRYGEFDYREDSTGLNTAINNPVSIIGITSTPALEVIDNVFERTRQFTQEIRLASSRYRAMDWVAGIYYLRQHIDRLEIFDFNALDTTEHSGQKNRTEGLSMFGDLRIALNPDLHLTLGLRYSYERKDITQSAIGANLILDEDFQIETRHSWKNISPRLVMDYSPRQGLMFYVSAARGFKSGGYQGQAPNADIAQTPFDEETVTNYETGVKFRSPGGRVSLDAGYYYADYKDMQISMFTGLDTPSNPQGFFLTANAADAFLKGYELEFSWRMFPALEIIGSIAKNRGEFTNFVDINDFDRDGTELDGYPETMTVFSALYTRKFQTGATLSLRLDHRYQGTAYRTFPQTHLNAIRSHRTYDAHASFTTARENWELNLWVKNLTDELYQSHTTEIDASYDLYAPPRTFGVSLSWYYAH